MHINLTSLNALLVALFVTGLSETNVHAQPTQFTPIDLGQTLNGFQDDFTGAARDPNWVAVGPGGDLYEQANGVLRVTVTDGTLNLGFAADTKGIPKIANLSVYEAPAPATLADAALKIETTSGLALLSWPVIVPASKVETSTTLDSASWQPLTLLPADFTEHQEIAVPITEPRRFFRLRKD